MLITYDDSTTNPHHYYVLHAPSKPIVLPFQAVGLETAEAALAYIDHHCLRVVTCSVCIAGYDDAKCQQSQEGMVVLQKIAPELEHLRFVSENLRGDIQYETWHKMESIQFPRMEKASLNLMMNDRGYQDFTMGVGMFPVTAQVEILVNPYHECHLRVMNDAEIFSVTISDDHRGFSRDNVATSLINHL
jgi:hypothetical protein